MQINYVGHRTYLDGLNSNWMADRPTMPDVANSPSIGWSSVDIFIAP